MMKYIKIGFWVLFAIAVVVGMSMSKSAQQSEVTTEPHVLIKVEGENNFLTENELKLRLKRKGLIYSEQLVSAVKIKEIEDYIESMSEIREARVYSSLGGNWNIDVILRKPIARIFNKQGESYYLDDTGHTMATSNVHTARVVVVTGNIPDRKSKLSVPEIINNDTLKTILFLDDIYRISHYVCSDPFLSAQIGQIHREKNGDFVLIPQVGGHIIIFGSANSDREVEKKFKKLVLFYKEGLPFEGWNKYSEINLKYEKQIVCKKKIIEL